jgi:outer membrane immunogenic protein
MRRVLFTTLGLFALTATSAVAADIPRAAPPYKAPAYVAPYNWSGFYVGVNGGYGWGRSSWDGFASGDFNTRGGLVGLTAGYNWQGLGSPWVFGLEGDVDWTNIRGSFTNAACPLGCETRNSWLGTVRGRVGVAWDRVMPYVTGGLAVGDVRANPVGFGGVSETKAGWTIGGGIEAAIAGNITAKVEYLYVDLGSIGCSAASCGVATNTSFNTSILRGGLNFRF